MTVTRFRCSSCGRRAKRATGDLAIALRLVCAMSHDNDVDYGSRMTESQWARLTAGVEQMRHAGCTLDDAALDEIATGEASEVQMRFGGFRGWSDVTGVLDEVFNGE